MKVGFSNANSGTQFAKKLKLKQNERARIVMLEDDPSFEWTHVVKDPTNPKNARYFKCLGDVDLLDNVGKDSESCPACAVARPEREAAVRIAQPRYATYVGMYQLKNDGKPVVPPTMEVIPWIFAAGKIRLIRDLIDEYGELTTDKDIVLICKNEQFQEFDMHVVDAVWPKSPDGKKQLQACLDGLPENTDEALCKQICTTLTEDQMRRMLDVAPPLDEDDIEEEVQRTVASMRADGLSDKAMAALDDDDDDDEPLAESEVASGFASLLNRSRSAPESALRSAARRRAA